MRASIEKRIKEASAAERQRLTDAAAYQALQLIVDRFRAGLPVEETIRAAAWEVLGVLA